jgi:hypothetical protein
MKRIKMAAILSATAWALLPGVSSAALSATDLVMNSPFVPTGWSPNAKTPAGTTGEQYVFRGVYSLGEDTFICIGEASGKSSWVKVGDSSGAIRALAYDAATRKATIQAGSREMTLSMPKPAESAAPVGVAVNSQERNRPRDLMAPPLRPGPRTLNRMQRANIPPPPWMNRDASGNLSGPRANTRWNAAGGNGGNPNNPGGDNGGGNNGGGDSGGNNPANPSNPGNPSNPANPNDPGDNLNVPPPPPAGVPPIPESIRQMIENGAAPEQPE